MALTDKDIVITPNRGQSADPKVEFKGASSTLGPQTISLNVYPTSNGTLSFEGSAGQLFSITNTLTGTIYSVNDVSGIPSIEVLDTGLVKLAQYSGNVLIGTATDTGHKVRVAGTTRIDGGGSQPLTISTSSSSPWAFGLIRTDTGADSKIFLHNPGSGSAWVFEHIPYFYNGGNYNVPLHNGNYNSYAPTLTGGGASGTWGISITGNAATITSQANSATISASVSVTGNDIVRRSNEGYIYANHVNFNTGVENPAIANFITDNGDGWSRKSSLDHVKNYIRSVADGTWSINITGTAGSAPATGGTATALNSGNYIARTGSSGNLNTDFNNTPAGTQRYQGDDAGLTNSPGGTWWIYEHKRHSNGSNYWGTQVAWGWEDNANKLAQRNVTGNSWSGWVYYLNSGNYNSYAPTLTGGGASGTWGINITGSAGSAGSVPASGITGQVGMWTSAQRPGPYRLYRRDDNSDYSVQTYWTGARWRLYGYNGDTGHADTHVGYADSAGSSGSSGDANYLITSDNRAIAPNEDSVYRMRFGFTSWNNNNDPPWADYLHMRSYGDNSGGSDNLVMFLKNGFGIRIWQQVFGSGSAYSDYRDVLTSGNYNSYALPISGGTATGRVSISVNGRTTGYSGSNFEVFTSDNTPPGISFHRGGYSATLLYENDGELYTNPWTSRAQTGKLLAAGNYNNYAPTLTGGGASGTWSINITGSAGSATDNTKVPLAGGTMTGALVVSNLENSIDVQHNGTGTAWRGRIISRNSSADVSSFLGNYNGKAGVFAHNNALGAWSSLYLNALGSNGQSNVYLPLGSTYTLNNSNLSYSILDASNYNSYSPTLTGGNASGTWSINITGSAATATDSTKVPLSGGTMTGTLFINSKLRVNNASGPSDNTYGTAADIPMHMSGNTRTQTTFLIENTVNSSIDYPVIVIRRTLTPVGSRFGGMIRFADKNSSGTEISSQIYSFNRLTSQDLFLDAGSGTEDRVVLRAGSSSSMQVAENFIMNVKAAITAVTTPAALDIDCKQSNYFTKTISGDSTFTFSNVPAPAGFTIAYSFTLELTHTAGVVTWPASVKWPGNVLPSLTTGKTHLFMFVTDDGGSRWRGSFLSNYDN